MRRKVCLITGVGPGTGSALVHRFSQDYQVAMLARSQDRLSNLEGQLEGVKGYPCDVSDRAALERVLDSVKDELGSPSILVHNAVGGAFGSFLDIEPSVLENNFQVNTMALLHLARSLAPDMVATGEGAIIITGNTSAYRGMPGFAGFAPTKAAQRVLAESMARDLGPKGVHVGYVAIDAVIDLEWTRERMPDKPDDYFCKPQDIAEECYRIAHQPRSAWSFNSIIRPFGENWSVS
ncbi:MAG: SDR family NAD(P)-dependent oxidoreductase [Gammaproteobacteria bacterium]|nr:SDR family NAD(P)-dependent oxidoreductase [Gammaproteobacteria bacterium]